ncbi:MAG TPA: SulP family inorganic anion transporter [Gammaproteobacteria bacterium]
MPEWIRAYRGDWLRPDLVAGLTCAAVVIPKAMAYATVAGLPIQAGLYTAFVPMVIYAALGSSRVLSVSTTTTIAILVAANLTQVVPDGDPAMVLRASATLTLLVGVFLVAASVFRLGFLANFISEPVLVGFKAGIGIVIVLDQLPKLLGVHFEKGTFLQNFFALLRSLPDTSILTLAVGLCAIAVMFSINRWLPRVPAPLAAIAAGIAGTAFFGLADSGVESVGNIPQGLPGLSLPDGDLVAQLWPGAAGIALMSFTESIAAARAFAGRDDPPLGANRELLATGLATAGGAFLGGMPAGGGTSQTAVNRLVGARSQMAGLITAGVTLLTMLFLAPLISLMPQATLAAVVIVYSLGLIQPLEFRSILAVRRMEFIWAVAAFAGVMLVGTLKGILVAIVISLFALAHQTAEPKVLELGRKRGTNVFRPRTAQDPDDETFPGLLLIRVVGWMFFVNYQSVFDRVRALVEKSGARVIAIDMSGVIDVEYTALKTMTTGEERLRERGITLWLVGLTPDVLAVVQRSPLGSMLGRERMFYTLEEAVAAWRAVVQPGDSVK